MSGLCHPSVSTLCSGPSLGSETLLETTGTGSSLHDNQQLRLFDTASQSRGIASVFLAAVQGYVAELGVHEQPNAQHRAAGDCLLNVALLLTMTILPSGTASP